MTKWEYLEIEVIMSGHLADVHADATLFKPDGKHIQKRDNYGRLLAQLGLEGWELIASSRRTDTSLGGKHRINYILKRPVKET